MFWCFLFKQMTAYEMLISDWSSDVCSSDLGGVAEPVVHRLEAVEVDVEQRRARRQRVVVALVQLLALERADRPHPVTQHHHGRLDVLGPPARSEERRVGK